MRFIYVATLVAAATAAVSVSAQVPPTTETSKGGSAMYHYGDPPTSALDADDYEIVDPDKIEDFLKSILGKYIRVHHEFESELVHIDILFFPPKDDRPFWTLVTAGMSGRPMTLPEDVSDAEDDAYAELVMSLPAGAIPKDENGEYDFEFFERDESRWSVDQLRALARFPHLYRTFFAAGHSITNGNPPEPLGPGTRMDSFVIDRPMTWPPILHQMKNSAGQTVNFLAVFPVFAEERQYKLDMGPQELMSRFKERGVSEVFESRRDSVVDALQKPSASPQ